VSDREENEIIRHVCEGNRHEYVLLVNRYKNQVFNLAYRMTGSYDDAEDLAQEIFAKAFQNLIHFDCNQKFFTWLYTIGLNLIRNHLKKRERTFTDDPLESVPVKQLEDKASGNPERIIMTGQDIRRLNAALLRLPGEFREAVLLRFQQGLNFNDIADLTGISQSAAKMRVYRGLEKLRELMEGDT